MDILFFINEKNIVFVLAIKFDGKSIELEENPSEWSNKMFVYAHYL